MKLSGRGTTFYLTEEGRTFLQMVTQTDSVGIVTADVEETDDVGIWLRIERNGMQAFLLLRWEFVLGIEVLDEKLKPYGLRG